MDVIDTAVEQGLHITSRSDLSRQTWEDFEREALGNSVILAGAGACAGCYFERYENSVMLDGVVQISSQKQGFYADDFIP